MELFSDITLEIQPRPTRTYKLDLEHGRIQGFTDGKEALLQAIEKIFLTERYAYETYTSNYGSEIEDLIGKQKDYVQTVLKQRVAEAILADDRFLSIEEFYTQEGKDSIICVFTVATILGNVTTQHEVLK